MVARDNSGSVNGYAVAHSMTRPSELDLDQFCDFMWWWCTRNAQDEQDILKLKAQVWRPPPGEKVIPKDSPWSAESEKSAFAAFKSQVTSK